MSKTIAILNYKGGVGKTMIAMNLAYSMAEFGYRILLVDLDTQANLTTRCLSENMLKKIDYFIGDSIRALVSGHSFGIKRYSPKANVSLIPSSFRSNIDITTTLDKKDPRLKYIVLNEIMRSINTSYDYAIIDCPPSPSVITGNAIAASDYILIPSLLEDDSFRGIGLVNEHINSINKMRIVRPKEISGIVLNQYDLRTRLAFSINKSFEEYYGNMLLKTRIRKNIKVGEAARQHMGVCDYDPNCNASKDFLSLCDEIILKCHEKKGNITY